MVMKLKKSVGGGRVSPLPRTTLDDCARYGVCMDVTNGLDKT